MYPVMNPSLTAQDEAFFERILTESVESGYVKDPGLGRLPVDYGRLSLGNMTCCVVCSGTGSNDKSGVILAIVLFVFSFFVGAYYTCRSAKSAVSADRDLNDLEVKELGVPGRPFSKTPVHHSSTYTTDSYTLTYTPYPPSAPPPYNPNVSDTPPPYDPRGGFISNAKILLEGRRQERAVTSGAQAMMTLGVGLITVALFVTLVAREQILMGANNYNPQLIMGVLGTGVFLSGLGIYMINYVSTDRRKAQEAANALYQLLNPSLNLN